MLRYLLEVFFEVFGAISLIVLFIFIVTSHYWYGHPVGKSTSFRYFWEIFRPALTVGLMLVVVPALISHTSRFLGEADWGDTIQFADVGEFLGFCGFFSLLITGGVILYWKQAVKRKEK